MAKVLRISTSRLASYAHQLKEFENLNWHDQSRLLEHGLLEMCILRGALVFDSFNQCWPNNNQKSSALYLNELHQLVSPQLFQMHFKFIQNVQRMDVDEPIIMMMILIVLFTPERMGLIDHPTIEKYQNHFTCLLDSYTKWRYGLIRSKCIFATLLTKLSDLRILSESHGTSLCSEIINNLSTNFTVQSTKENANQEFKQTIPCICNDLNQPFTEVSDFNSSYGTNGDNLAVIDVDLKIITDLISVDESLNDMGSKGDTVTNLPCISEGELEKILEELKK